MLYKRSKKPGAHYWVRFTVRGQSIRVTSGTDRKALAEEFERRLRDQIYREQDLGEISYSWDEAKERWLKEKAYKRSIRRDRDAFAACEASLAGKALRDIDGDTLSELTDALATRRKPGAVNRVLACVRSVLNACVKWGWLTSAPKVALLYVEKKPRRWERPEQIATLRAELPPHAIAIVSYAVAVGQRSGNIFGLRWAQVDMERRSWSVESSEFKGKRTVGFPLNDAAMEVLRGQVGKHPVYVFPDHRGRAPLKSIKTTWRKACKRAGLEGFRVHDLRHTWTAWHKLKGTPDRAIKELGGWATMAMVEEYGHINPQDYVQYVDNSLPNSGTQSEQKKRKAR